MRIGRIAIVSGILLLTTGGRAAQFSVRLDGGRAQVYQHELGIWSPLTDSMEIVFHDSVTLDSGSRATVLLGQQVLILTRGPTRLGLFGENTDIGVGLSLGQLFLTNRSPHEFSSVKIAARGCTVTPVGTAAAVKITPSGDPTVAVLQGRMKMEAPSGEAVLVNAGEYAIFGAAAGDFKEGSLSERAIDELRQWSGLPFEKQADTPPASAAKSPVPGKTSPAAPVAAAVTPSGSKGPDKGSPPVAKQRQKEAATSPGPQAKSSDHSRQEASADRSTAKKEAARSGETPASGEEKPGSTAPEPSGKPMWEISAANVTVDDEQWTRLAVGVDIPIWKFGLFLDLELFMDADGRFSDKGWRFKEDTWLESLSRKIRYVRFGHEQDPVFAKIGGLGGVTLGYGFIVDRFTNMLRYPDEKLLGLQFYLNDIGPVGITVQTMVGDFMEFNNDAGLVAGRLGLTPLKKTEIPIVKGITIAGCAAVDLNQYSPAHGWRREQSLDDKNRNGLKDTDWAWRTVRGLDTAFLDANRGILFDTTDVYPVIDTTYRDSTEAIAIAGGDLGIPIIRSALLNLDVYGQAAMIFDYDDEGSDRAEGWGIGAPGVSLKVGPFWGQLEYRHSEGMFTPGFFGPYYLDQRVRRYPSPRPLESALIDQDLNGIFGSAGVNIADAVTVNGSYTYMVGDEVEYQTVKGVVREKALDHRAEAKAGLGELVLGKIPKLSKAEAYFYKTNIWRNYHPRTGSPDGAFHETPTMFYGYRLGVEITQGASLIWDARYGYRYDENSRLVPNNNISIQTAVTF